jgi:large-conductance mechanosensitive channel
MSGGPIYYGAVVCFLFILSLLLLQGALKWGIIASFSFFVILAWGQNFPVVSDLMYDYFPLYAKFRDTKMTLLVAQPFVILTIGAGLMRLASFDPKLYEHTLSAKLLPKLKQTVSKQGYVVLAAAIALGICVVTYLYTVMGTLSAPKDIELAAISPTLVAAMEADRAALAQADIVKAIGFILVATFVLYLYAKETLKLEMVGVALALLACIDLGMVNRDYVNEDSYKKRARYQDDVPPTQQDLNVLKDKSLYYRVIDYSRGAPSQNAMASAFHKSIGGYFAAKPLLYQELWERYQMDNPNVALQNHINIFNMLNLKYILVPDGRVMDNPTALGNAWFVNKVEVVPNADAELAAIDDLEPINTAVVQQRYADYVTGLNSEYTPGDRIALTAYHPDTMRYEYTSQNERFAVFSDMYYPPEKGWKVYIDGEEVAPFVKTNYLLRGLRVPAGTHKVTMIFAPASILTGRWIGSIVSLMLIAFLVFSIVQYYRKPKNKDVPNANVEEYNGH